MDRTERFYKIDQLLKDGKVVSFARFQDALGVSRATVKRDLLYMRDRFNAPIEFDRAANGYRFGKPCAGPRYELPGLWFNATGKPDETILVKPTITQTFASVMAFDVRFRSDLNRSCDPPVPLQFDCWWRG